MTISEFAADYNLHDSYIESLSYDTVHATLTLMINYAFWMQKDFREGEEETGPIEVVFRNVTGYTCSGGDPTGAFVGILNAVADEGGIVISLFDDRNGDSIEMRISSSEADVRTL